MPMRAYRLVHVAAEAELIRWKSMATRTAMRVVFALIALVFLLGVLVFAHILAWYWIRLGLGQNFYITACILGGVDLLVALICGFMAARSSPSRQEREALEVRKRAVASIGSALSLGQMAIPVLRLTNTLLRRART